jgi:hypothetical protein
MKFLMKKILILLHILITISVKAQDEKIQIVSKFDIADFGSKQFIIENKLDTNIYMMHHYSVLLFKLYDAYDEFCTNTGGEKIVDKPKSFPKFISNLTRFV